MDRGRIIHDADAASLADRAPVMIWMSGPDAKCTFFNKGWLEFTGRSLAQELGDGWAEGVHPADRDLCIREYLRAFEARRSFTLEYRLRRADGNYRWILDHGAPLLADDGEFLGYNGSCIDITQRRAIEHRHLEAAAIFEATPDAIFSIDRERAITSWNTGAQRIYAFAPDQIIGRPVSTILHERQEPEYHDLLSRALRGESVPGHETVHRGRDGAPVNVALTLSPIRNENREVIGVAHCARDITARVQAERRFHLAVEGSPYGNVLVDARGTILLANPAAERLFGYAPGELVGRSVEQLVPPDLRDAHRGHRRAFVEDARVRQMGEGRQLFGQRKDGSRFLVEIGLNPMATTEGAVVLATIADVSEWQETRAALKRALEGLRAKNAELEQFVHTVSHDLKSPLVTISGMAGYLKRLRHGGEVSDAGAVLQSIEDAALAMRRRIDDLLEMARLGHVGGEPARVPIIDLVRQVLSELDVAIGERNAVIHVDEPLPVVYADPNQIRRVFENLIGNALVHACTVESPEIHIGCRCADQSTHIFVRDNGPGIDPAHHDRIFELFTRASTRTEGAGVGLALTKRVMDNHAGRVWVESKLGQGATFWLDFSEALWSPPATHGQ